jgi:hypothetical protein
MAQDTVWTPFGEYSPGSAPYTSSRSLDDMRGANPFQSLTDEVFDPFASDVRNFRLQ